MEHVPTVQNDPLKGSDLSLAKEEKDKGSAFIARERFPYFLLVALVRPAIDKASPPLAPFLATLTLSHPLCTLFHAALYLEMHFPSSPSTPFDSPSNRSGDIAICKDDRPAILKNSFDSFERKKEQRKGGNARN